MKVAFCQAVFSVLKPFAQIVSAVKILAITLNKLGHHLLALESCFNH